MRDELEAEQNCNILTPTLMALTAFLSRSPGLLNRGLGAHPLRDMFLIPASSLQLQLNFTAQLGAWGLLVFSTASFLQMPEFLSSPGLYNCSTYTFFLWASQIALNSTRPWSRLYSDIPRPDAPVIYTGIFPILTAWLGSIC